MKQQDGSWGTAKIKYKEVSECGQLAGRARGWGVLGAMLGSLLGSFQQGGEMPLFAVRRHVYFSSL